ncbi:MFS transporter [Gulosibacter sediminis]|uniref:MFS transporter n=1 Tax=Gulosibacter sediminis TaxID=1729695 RepID=UPI0024A822A5|nr:MFS transporter [Gulosibacter sediminis]
MTQASFWSGSRVFSLVAVVLLAGSLRAGVTAFGPLAVRIGADVGLSATEVGALAALPVLAFGLFAVPTAPLARRLGFDRLALLSLIVLAVGLGLRLLMPEWSLWIGTALLGVGVATLNVLLPVLVKRDFAPNAPLVLGITTCTMTGTAALGAGLAVAITDTTGGQWRLALAASLPVVVVAIALFAVRGWRDRLGIASSDHSPHVNIWRSPIAWSVTAYMALQSTVFYTFVNWMPTIEQSSGVSEVNAGLHLAIAQVSGMPLGFLVAWLMNRLRDQRIIAVGFLPITAIALLGGMFLPHLMPVWTVMIGLTTGMMLPVALGLISERAATAGDAARMSGMAQSIGYFCAGLGPIVGGVLFEATGSWMATLGLLLACVTGLVFAGLAAGRDRTLGSSAAER